MSADSLAPGARQKPFAAYLDRLARAAGHLYRVRPLKSYCTDLLFPGERKSVERICPDNVRQTHQALHHIMAQPPWKDDDLLEAVRRYVVPTMLEQGKRSWVGSWMTPDW
jgi:SRSO17 transposase